MGILVDEEKGVRDDLLHNEGTPLIAASAKIATWDGAQNHGQKMPKITQKTFSALAGELHLHQNHFLRHDDNNYCMVITNTRNNAKVRKIAINTKPKAATDNPVLKRLKLATGLCCAFMLVEVIGGYLAGSLAILSDAAHLTADLASFAVAIIAAHLAARPSTQYHTYGLKRTESLAALFSMTTLAVISIGLGLEAFRRIYNLTWGHTRDTVDGKFMSGIATIGVFVNVALAAVLGEHHVHMPGHDHDHEGHDHGHSHHHGHGDEEGATKEDHHDHDHGGEEGHKDHDHADDDHADHDHDHGGKEVDDHDHSDHDHSGHGHSGHDHSDHDHSDHDHHHSHNKPSNKNDASQQQRNVNLHAAYLHVLGDLAQSVAILVAGLLIWWKPQWQIVDPIATVLFCVFVFWSTLGVIRASVCVLLEEVPPTISWQTVYDSIAAVPSVCDVHDLHIWSISQGVHAMSVHLRLEYFPATAPAPATANTADRKLMDYNDCAKQANEILKTVAKIAKQNGIVHSTIQLQHTTGDDGDGIQQSCICCDLGGDESMAHNFQKEFR